MLIRLRMRHQCTPYRLCTRARTPLSATIPTQRRETKETQAQQVLMPINLRLAMSVDSLSLDLRCQEGQQRRRRWLHELRNPRIRIGST